MLLGLCACSKPGNEVDTPDPTQEPTLLQINENVNSAKSTGGEYAFTYVVEGGENIPEITVESQDEWIHDLDTSTDGVVRFIVDANLASSRISRITIYCGKLKDDIVVSQSAVSGNAEVTFDMTYDIDGPYVTMNVTPDPEGVRYYAWYYDKKMMESALSKSPGVTLEMYLEKVVEGSIIVRSTVAVDILPIL